MISFLVLTGDGINCEKETARALTESGAKVDIFPVSQILENKALLKNYQGLVFPGGFSFGDDLGSGKVAALQIRYRMLDAIEEFLKEKKLILGICNGFQILVQLGLLPGMEFRKDCALLENSSGSFINQWVELKISPTTNSHWLKNIRAENVHLPIRHGEGRFYIRPEKQLALIEQMKKQGQIAFQYVNNVNGSLENIAALSDVSGQVLGIMPHPEAAYFQQQMPFSDLNKPFGKILFQNAMEYFQ
jgi:phosphoribosylformylglycinamidine synthase I